MLSDSIVMEEHRKRVRSVLLSINSDFAYVKYSIYRIALKLGKLQDFLCLSSINLDMVRSQVKQHLYSKLSFGEIKELLINVFNSSCNVESTRIESIATNIAVIVYDLFSSKQEATVQVRFVIFFLVLISWDEVKKKYEIIFQLYSSSNTTLHRSSLTRMLDDTMKVLGVVSESVGGVGAVSDRCCYSVYGLDISESSFLKWAMDENNKCFIWLPTMHRLKYASATVHNVQCSSCGISPIVGMRFQCLKCLSYNSCQVCFFLQKVDEGSDHRVSHPQQEYCSPAGKKDELNSFARTIRNKITKRYKHKSRSLADDHGPDRGNLSVPAAGVSPPPTSASSAPAASKITETDVREIVKKENTLLKALVTKLNQENQVIAKNVKLLEEGTTNKDAHSLEVLHSIVNNLEEHNKSLENELENLKSAFFAKTGNNNGDSVRSHRAKHREDHSSHSDVSTASRRSQSDRSSGISTVRRRSASTSRRKPDTATKQRRSASTSRRPPVARARTSRPPRPVQYSQSATSSNVSHRDSAQMRRIPADQTSSDESVALTNGAVERTNGGEDDIGDKLDNLLANLQNIELQSTVEDNCAHSLCAVSSKIGKFLEQALMISQGIP